MARPRLLAQYRGLPPYLKLFLDLVRSGHSPEQAVKAVRGSVMQAGRVGEMWMQRPEIQAAIRELDGNDASRSLVKMAQAEKVADACANYDDLDFYDEREDGSLVAKRLSAIHPAKRKAIVRVRKDTKGVPYDYDLCDRSKWHELHVKHHGGFIERHEHTGAGGAPIQTQDVSLTDAELAKRIVFILARAMAQRNGSTIEQPSLPVSQTLQHSNSNT